VGKYGKFYWFYFHPDANGQFLPGWKLSWWGFTAVEFISPPKNQSSPKQETPSKEVVFLGNCALVR
jgi:hypothetical protein